MLLPPVLAIVPLLLALLAPLKRCQKRRRSGRPSPADTAWKSMRGSSAKLRLPGSSADSRTPGATLLDESKSKKHLSRARWSTWTHTRTHTHTQRNNKKGIHTLR